MGGAFVRSGDFSFSKQNRYGSIAFSRGEKVPEGRMRGLRLEYVALSRRNRTANPLIRRMRATFSPQEKVIEPHLRFCVERSKKEGLGIDGNM